MLAFLFGLIDPISKIVQALANAKVDLAKAETDQERIHAQERISALESQKAVLVAESGNRINAMIRAGFALPFVIYNAKLVLWDKILGLGSTDALSTELFQIEMICIGFYFLHSIASTLKR